MAADIFFDPVTREIQFSSNGDFETTDNPSVQNGAILLEARAMNILFPAAGVGFNSQIIGSATSEAAFQLNRWNAQISADGGKSKWRPLANANDQNFNFEADVNYIQS